jgi:hypothetical protein
VGVTIEQAWRQFEYSDIVSLIFRRFCEVMRGRLGETKGCQIRWVQAMAPDSRDNTPRATDVRLSDYCGRQLHDRDAEAGIDFETC